jgi:hypothetical protein
MLVSEDVEVHFHALYAMTEELQLCEWGYCFLGKLHHLSRKNVWIMRCA